MPVCSATSVGGPPMASSRPVAVQLVGDGDGVGRLTPVIQRLDRVVDVTVGRLVEVGCGEADLGRGADGVGRQQHGAEQRRLGGEVVRRDARAGIALTARIVEGLNHGDLRSSL